MNDGQHDRFDLAEFVLGYLEEQGSIVMPPAFGIYDVLMPEELAGRLKLADYQRLSFVMPVESRAAGDALQLSVNHPLVETIAQAATVQPANVHAYINGVRLDKRGLAELAAKTLSFPNARLDAMPNTQEQRALHHYLHFNFKITIVGEEKQEDLVTVVMDVQAGHAIRDTALLRRLDIFELERAFPDLPVAPPRWLGAGPALTAETFQQLLPRAESALQGDLADQVAALATRMERHLTLDLARITDYYDELAADLQRRRARLDEENADRSRNLDDKLAVLEAERAAKLQDARSRYAVRVEVELVNILLLAQPKVILPVTITNRTATITRSVVWDPLVHRLEPLVCDVCGQPGEGLHLCTGGHLAHAGCLAPQCVDCKRSFCGLCAAQVAACVVCQRPVCRPSLITCPTCGRGTCREHQQLCHAAQGQPVSLSEPAAQAPASKPPPAAPVQTPQPPEKPRRPPPASAGPRPNRAQPPEKPVSPASTAPVAKGVRIDVQIYETEPVIAAFVMRSTHRILATRSFELTPQGILVRCDCEKSPCPADSYYHRPAGPGAIKAQVEALLQRLLEEYLIPEKRMHYVSVHGQRVVEIRRLELPAAWRDLERLAEAARGFDRLARE